MDNGNLEIGGTSFSEKLNVLGNIFLENDSNKLIFGTGKDAEMYYNGTNYVRLGFGTAGHFLKTQGTGNNPIWAAASGGGGGNQGGGNQGGGSQGGGNQGGGDQGGGDDMPYRDTEIPF